ADIHETRRRQLANTIGAATAALLDRDRAILAVIQRDRARLALPMLEPDLFHRRPGHTDRAQERLADAALDVVAWRIAALEGLHRLREGDRVLLFAAATNAC